MTAGPMHARVHRPRAVALLAVALAAVGVAGCGSDGGRASGPTPDPTTTSVDRVDATSTTRPPAAAVTVAPCSGDAPMWCITTDGAPAGALERLRWRADEMPRLEELPADALRVFTEDRRAGCGEDHRLEPLPVHGATVAGLPGIRYGWRATGPDGVERERHLSFAAQDGDEIVLFATSAYAPDACPGPALGEPSPAVLAASAEAITEAVAELPPR